MAKMSAMALEIEERLVTGATHNEIAEALEVPVEWVEAVVVMVSRLYCSQSANRQDSRKRIVNEGLLSPRFLSLFSIRTNRNAPQKVSKNFFSARNWS
jgi:hypothetical protein